MFGIWQFSNWVLVSICWEICWNLTLRHLFLHFIGHSEQSWRKLSLSLHDFFLISFMSRIFQIDYENDKAFMLIQFYLDCVQICSFSVYEPCSGLSWRWCWAGGPWMPESTRFHYCWSPGSVLGQAGRAPCAAQRWFGWSQEGQRWQRTGAGL